MEIILICVKTFHISSICLETRIARCRDFWTMLFLLWLYKIKKKNWVSDKLLETENAKT
jgi:hypothetical protein